MPNDIRLSPSGPDLLPILGSDQVDNASTVPGTTLSDALDALDVQLPVTTNGLSNQSTIPGATVTDALDAVADPVTTSRLADLAITQPKILGGILVSLGATLPSATNATTNLSAGSYTILGGTTLAGDTYRSYIYWSFDHTAAATPTLTIEWVFGGAVLVTRVITPQASAGVFSGIIEAHARFRSNAGVSGTAAFSIKIATPLGNTVQDRWGGASGNFSGGGINTSIDQALELRMRMTTAVPANTLTLQQAWLEKLITI